MWRAVEVRTTQKAERIPSVTVRPGTTVTLPGSPTCRLSKLSPARLIQARGRIAYDVRRLRRVLPSWMRQNRRNTGPTGILVRVVSRAMIDASAILS